MNQLQMKESNNSGSLITFCGLDGSGKTTMIQYLKEYFESKGINPVMTKQPTQQVRNSEIFRSYMDTPDHDEYSYRSLSLLAASDRLQHSNKYIEPLVKSGNIVISDRYFYSCLANLRARGFYRDKWIYEIANYILKPNISFFIDVPVETAVERVRSREEEKDRYIDMELQYRLREEYLNIANEIGGVVISSENSIENCKQIIMECIQEKLKKVG